MEKVAISELRQHLPEYLARTKRGETFQVTQHGRVVARLVPERDTSAEARQQLAALRKTAKLGDIYSPIGEAWKGERDPV